MYIIIILNQQITILLNGIMTCRSSQMAAAVAKRAIGAIVGSAVADAAGNDAGGGGVSFVVSTMS